MNKFQVSLPSVLVGLILITACGGNHVTTSAPVTPSITVAISPSSITLDQGATTQFTATVNGSTNSAVVWSIAEGSTGGTISEQGLYTAGSNGGVFHVTATSAADSRIRATAQVSVNNMAINISPTLGDMEPGTNQQFTATVTGTVNHNVTWNIQEGAAGGAITNDGLYTAPTSAGRFHVVAYSAANTRYSMTAAVTVANLSVVINPHGVGVPPGGVRGFTASVSGCMDDRVTWAVQEGNVGGVLTVTNGSAVQYTAPMGMGQYHVVATSVSHPNVSSTATVLVGSSSFTTTAPMTQSRSYHSATLLPSGDVLLAGGEFINDRGYSQVTETAELFDHSTGTFRTTGSMKEAREAQTATLLNDGTVLITGGGWLGWSSTKSAELYDPKTGQFTPSGSMMIDRISHTATLLNNGKVLIIGGDSGSAADTAPAELYDPTTKAFSLTGRMQQRRSSHTATLLPDGRVLVAGGYTGNTIWEITGSTNSAEIFDSVSGTFIPAGSFIGDRASHTATLLASGQIVLAGGVRADPYSSTYEFLAYDDAQSFDPAATLFTFLAQMNAFRSSHTATLLSNGQILVAGGGSSLSQWTPDNTAELFDPTISAFNITGGMAKPRLGHSATLLLDGRVLITGGTSEKAAELYTPQN